MHKKRSKHTYCEYLNIVNNNNISFQQKCLLNNRDPSLLGFPSSVDYILFKHRHKNHDTNNHHFTLRQ